MCVCAAAAVTRFSLGARGRHMLTLWSDWRMWSYEPGSCAFRNTRINREPAQTARYTTEWPHWRWFRWIGLWRGEITNQCDRLVLVDFFKGDDERVSADGLCPQLTHNYTRALAEWRKRFIQSEFVAKRTPQLEWGQSVPRMGAGVAKSDYVGFFFVNIVWRCQGQWPLPRTWISPAYLFGKPVVDQSRGRIHPQAIPIEGQGGAVGTIGRRLKRVHQWLETAVSTK